MSISEKDLEKFLSDNADKEGSETLIIESTSSTDPSVRQYKVKFYTPEEEKKEAPKKKTPSPAKKDSK